MFSIHDVWDLWRGQNTGWWSIFRHWMYACVCVQYVFIRWGLTKSNALILCSLSFDSLFDDSLSGTMETALPTFDPVHQLDLLQFRVKPLEIPAHTQGNTQTLRRHVPSDCCSNIHTIHRLHKCFFSCFYMQIFYCISNQNDEWQKQNKFLTFQWCHRHLFWSKLSFLDPTDPETTTASHLRVEWQTHKRKRCCLMERDFILTASENVLCER